MGTQKVQFEFELPDELMSSFDSLDAASQEAKEAFVMELLRQGKLSQGRAAELLSVNRWELPDLMTKHGLPSITVEPDEIKQDTQSLKQTLEKDEA